MSEEEIMKYLESYIQFFSVLKAPEPQDAKMMKAVKGIIDLYNKEKEKNKELENCLQMAKQKMTADISEDFDCMKLKEFKEYLLNEIKLNENFEE